MCSDEALDAAVLEFYRLNPDERAEPGTDEAARRANLSRAVSPSLVLGFRRGVACGPGSMWTRRRKDRPAGTGTVSHMRCYRRR